MAKVEDENAALKAENAALKARAESALKAILNAVTTGEFLFLIRLGGSRQFGECRVGGIPSPPAAELQFDRTWAAAACTDCWKGDIDGRVARRHPRAAARPQQFPAYRSVIIEAYRQKTSAASGSRPAMKCATALRLNQARYPRAHRNGPLLPRVKHNCDFSCRLSSEGCGAEPVWRWANDGHSLPRVKHNCGRL
jgi:cytochrome c553